MLEALQNHKTRYGCQDCFQKGIHSTRFQKEEGRKNVFYLTMHSTDFIYGYNVLDMW